MCVYVCVQQLTVHPRKDCKMCREKVLVDTTCPILQVEGLPALQALAD